MDQRSRSIVQSVAQTLKLDRQRNNQTSTDNLGETANEERMKRTLHDLDAYKVKKLEESSPFFKTARVQTCSHVMMRNGKAIAVAFPLEKTGWKNPNSYGNAKRSSETDSWSK